MSSNDNLPDWLRQLRDQQMGADAHPAPPPQSAPLPQPAEWETESEVKPEAAPSRGDELDALREIARAEPLPPVEVPRRLDIPILNQLTPFQRFVLALMLFLNVSVLGCLFLMVMEKISFVR